jgi:hypothetical protein
MGTFAGWEFRTVQEWEHWPDGLYVRPPSDDEERLGRIVFKQGHHLWWIKHPQFGFMSPVKHLTVGNYTKVEATENGQ